METEAERNKKVCIIDDEASIRDIYQTALSADGYEVVTAVDGEDGLRVIREQKPDIILVDIMMPKMDGLELMREIRKDSDFHKIPIIVMTNVDDRNIAQKAGNLNVEFYLTKSLFEPKKVVAIVAEALQHK